MPRYERNGSRKPRELARHRTPLLGYYFIVTDTKETGKSEVKEPSVEFFDL